MTHRAGLVPDGASCPAGTESPVESNFADNAAHVVAVCTALDGNTLAIEPAARQIPDDTAPPRQRSLSDTISWSYELLSPGLRKPDPAIYRLAVARLGVPANRCAFADDIAAYLEPARELGMTTVHATDPATTVAALEHLFGLGTSLAL